MLTNKTMMLDDDDRRAVDEAIAYYQTHYRWENFGADEPGVFLPEGA